ncbi:hypothetical protein I6L27_19685 (plasmid) [Acinetobacter pittii]|uniref:hypothetical protein n=1 Tax=Acinetobacter TaxID=469 RepID=UPI001C225CD6|nr:hypothetical protein [Acinetobacter pittii]QXA10018.1 hypothetical protein I6L27_19685 [Acinetobacter pittii]
MNNRFSFKDIIVTSDREQKMLDYILTIKSKYDLELIMAKFSAETKPYISNIVKYGNIQVPDFNTPSKGYTFDEIIIENERDQQALDYMVSVRGKAGVEAIMKHFFSGGTRPYVSNIAKYGKIELPTEFNKPVSSDERRSILDDLKKQLKR